MREIIKKRGYTKELLSYSRRIQDYREVTPWKFEDGYKVMSKIHNMKVDLCLFQGKYYCCTNPYRWLYLYPAKRNVLANVKEILVGKLIDGEYHCFSLYEDTDGQVYSAFFDTRRGPYIGTPPTEEDRLYYERMEGLYQFKKEQLKQLSDTTSITEFEYEL